MATHDYVIANASGSSVRQDINNALAAIVSNNSNDTSPATTYPYQWWADTTTGQLKLRASDNLSWITIFELDGTMLMEDGSLAAPGLAFASDLDTGFSRSAADKINFSTGGAERLEIGSSEVVFNDPSNDVDFRVESNGKSHMLFVDAGNDAVGIGASSPAAYIHIEGAGTGTETYGRFTTGSANGDQSLVIKSGSSRDHMAIQVSTNAGANDDLSLQPDGGNVGIGTTSPDYKLTVADTSSYVIQNFKSSNTEFCQISFGDTDAVAQGKITYENGTDALSLTTNGSERMRIDSSGRLMLGTSTTRAGGIGIGKGFSSSGVPAAGTSTSSLLVGNDDGGSYGLAMGANGSGNGYIQAQRSDGNTTLYDLYLQPNGGNVGIGTTSVTNGALVIEKVGFQVSLETGTSGDGQLRIGHFADGAFIGTYGDDGGAADFIRFGTHSGDERVRIQSAGGISFNGDTATANALDDYEEGTWTPTLNTGTATLQKGVYIKIGSFVWLKGQVTYTITDTGTEYLRLGGLPFSIPSDDDNRGYQVAYVGGRSQTHAWETFDGTGNLALSTGGTTFLGDRSVFSGKNIQFNFFYPSVAL